jgi:ATP-dependent exoDNAse (exonuclease V) alpha subunit
MTIHKYVSLCDGKGNLKKHAELDSIFVDEISMTHEVFYKFFLTLKRHYNYIKFIISGDFEQLLPVNDRVSDCDYKNSLALHELCDGNRIQLLKCRRADDKLFKLCDPAHVMFVSKNMFNNKFTDLHLCFTNFKRKNINNIMMRKVVQNSNVQPLMLKALDYDDNSQDVFLLPNMPVICRKTKNKLNIVNNQSLIIEHIDKKKKVICMSDDVAIAFEDFQKFFYVAYCITTHKSQAKTIREPYTIHEWDKMDRRLRYVALSRATCCEHINII